MKQSTKGALFYHVCIIVFGLFMLYPLIWMLIASFKTQEEIFTSLYFFPRNPTFENYISGWKGVAGFSYARFLVNSMFLAVVAIAGNLISCSMTSFAFAKLQFKLNKVLFAILLLTMMLPFHVKLIPTYIIYNTLHWVDTFLPLTVPTFFATNGFYCFLMVQFMRTMSNELLEAPRIDGCGTFQIYMRFILPLSSPVLVTVAIFTFIGVWNDFMSQMIYLSNPRLFTVSLALRMFVDATGQSSYGSLFAMSIVSLIPLFVVFIIFQRHLIEGITTGSLKG